MKATDTSYTTEGYRMTFGAAAGYVDKYGREFHCKACHDQETDASQRDLVRRLGYRDLATFKRRIAAGAILGR